MNVIYKTLPRHTEENIALDQVLEIYFMVDINKNTFTLDNVILFNISEQLVEPVTFDYNRRVLKVKPVGKLGSNNHYQLQLIGGPKGIKDITGRSMAQTFELEFTTKDTESIKPPRVLSPADVSVVREAATIQLEPNKNADYYEIQISKSNTFHHLIWPTNGEKVYSTPEITVTPDIPYETGLYYMRVRSVGDKGELSSWSDAIRFFYEGAPIIRVPEEEPMPDEAIPEETEEETVTVQSKRVILQTKSQPTEDQLTKLQNVFSAKAGETLTSLRVKASSPKDKSVNNNVANFNSVLGNGNQKKIVIEFTEDIDPATVSKLTAYILSERN